MNKVVKVSIGNMAFTLEEEAYTLLNNYLNSLRGHYVDNPNGEEIIDGIEERIAELFIEKSGPESVITPIVVEEVITILGNPDDIDGDSGEREKPKRKNKKFYRSPYNKIAGGVCSGLAEYYEKETILFRIIFVLAAIIMAVGSHGFGFLGACLVYVILWIVIPEAKTVEQRCAMRGEKNTIDSIEKSIEKGAKEIEDDFKRFNDKNPNFWKNVGTCFEKIFGLIFSIAGLTLLIAMIVAFFGYKLWNFAIPFTGIDLLSSFNSNPMALSIWLKILLSCALFIPIVAFLYAGIQMLFSFKSPKWRPGLILFLVWISSIIALACIGATSSVRYWKSEPQIFSENVTLQSDTLYIEFNQVAQWEDEKVYVEADRNEYKMVFFELSRNGNRIITYPEIELVRNNNGEARFSSKTNLFTKTLSLSEINESSGKPFYSFDGKVIKIDPIIYGNGNVIKDIKREIRLFIDKDITVIVKEPIYHQFENHFEYSNVEWLHRFDKWD